MGSRFQWLSGSRRRDTGPYGPDRQPIALDGENRGVVPHPVKEFADVLEGFENTMVEKSWNLC